MATITPCICIFDNGNNSIKAIGQKQTGCHYRATTVHRILKEEIVRAHNETKYLLISKSEYFYRKTLPETV